MPPEQNQNPLPDYDFINNSPSEQYTQGRKQRIRLVIIGAVGLVLFLFLLFGLIFSGGNGNVERLVGIVGRQTELVRVATLGEKGANATDVRQFAGTVRLSLTSAQSELRSYVQQQDRPIKTQELNGAKDTDTDKALTAAQQANRFDEEFTSIMSKQLAAYRQELREAFDASNSDKERQVLQGLYTKARTLTAESSSTTE